MIVDYINKVLKLYTLENSKQMVNNSLMKLFDVLNTIFVDFVCFIRDDRISCCRPKFKMEKKEAKLIT